MPLANHRSALHDALALFPLRGCVFARTAAEVLRGEPLGALLVLGAAAVGMYHAVAWFGAEAGCRLYLAVPLVLILLIHGNRSDERLLHLAGRSPRLLYAVEYAAIAAPSLVVMLLARCPAPWIGGIAALPLAAAALPAGHLLSLRGWRGRRTPMRVPLPPRAFEWIAGLRVHGGSILLVYALALAFSSYPGALLLAILVLTWTVSLFQLPREGLILLEALGTPPRRLLHGKVARSALLFLIAAAPLALLFLARHPALWAVLAAVLAGCLAVHAGSVLLKYALYRDGGEPGVIGPLTVAGLTAAAAVPPVAAYLLYRLWRMALLNLHRRLG